MGCEEFENNHNLRTFFALSDRDLIMKMVNGPISGNMISKRTTYCRMIDNRIHVLAL